MFSGLARVRLSAAHVLLATALLASPTTASQPIQQDFGPWHVISTTSVSGANDEDAIAVLRQGNDAAELIVRWVQGERVKIFLRIKDCNGEGNDFERSGATGPGKVLRRPVPEFAQHLRADFTAWLKEARLNCRPATNGSPLRLENLDPAAAWFLARLRYLAPELQPKSVGDRNAHRH